MAGRGSSKDEALHYFVLDEDHGDEVFQFLKEYYFTRGPINVATEGGLWLDRPYVKKDLIPSGVSVGVRDSTTNALVGAVLSYTKRRGQNIDLYGNTTTVAHQGMKRFRMVMSHLNDAHDVFGDTSIDKMIYLAVVATRPDYGGRGIGIKLLKMSEDIGKSQGCQVASAEALSPIAQRMLRKLRYEVVYSLDCKDFKIDGEKMFVDDLLPENGLCEVFVKHL